MSKHLKAPQCDMVVEKVQETGKRLRAEVWTKQFIAMVIRNHSTASPSCQAKYSPIPEVE
jgi:hypothetical protein